MASTSLPPPAPWTVVVDTGSYVHHVSACDRQEAVTAAWFQAAGHAGRDYPVTIRIEGPGQPLPTLTIPATYITGWPEPEPDAWELEPEPVEEEEDELLAALATWR
jgi:hypothetical protein